MIIEAIFERFKGVLKLLAQGVKVTFFPTRVGREIKLGDKADFNFRLTFFLAMGALAMAMQGVVAASLGLSQMPGSLDAYWEYLQPWGAGVLIFAYYLPMRLFGFTSVKFSEYFQVAAMNMAPGFLFQLCGALSVFVTFRHYGTPDVNHPLVGDLIQRQDVVGLKQCLPQFDSYYCLSMLSQYAPEAQWTNYLEIGAFAVWCIIGARLFYAALGVAYWKQIISFWMMVAMLVSALFAVELF
jgi:hypothetical protein